LKEYLALFLGIIIFNNLINTGDIILTNIATNPTQLFKTTVDKIDFSIEAGVNFSQSLHMYETQKVASDLTGITYELKLFYMNQTLAFSKPLIVTGNQVGIDLANSELIGLGSKGFVVEIYKTEGGISTKISEGKLHIT
jgi:hypothetical protein